MSSKLFREELERVLDQQMHEGGDAPLLQRIREMVGGRLHTGTFRSPSCVLPINDIRGIEGFGYEKGEKILRCKLAACYRLVDLFGWTQTGINGQITARLNTAVEQVLTTPRGLLPHEVTASALAKVDMQGAVQDQGTTNYPVDVDGFSLHASVHAARPDLRCVLHLRSPPALAVSSCKRGLLPLCHEAALVGDVAYHRLVRALGPSAKVLMLPGSGALCCGASLEEAFHQARQLTAACEVQLRLAALPMDELSPLDPETRLKIYEHSRTAPAGDSKWRVGGEEFEALMRMLDNAGFRTGYIYRHPLIKNEVPKPKNDVEVPPAVSSLGYLLEEEELIWKRGTYGKTGERTRWLNSPNVYQKVEVLETGTNDPKKITKWVQDGSPAHSSTPVKIDTLQFVPKNTNPKEFKALQQQLLTICAKMNCLACSEAVHKDLLLMCSSCKGGYHYSCVSVPTEHYEKYVKSGNNTWRCPSCSNVTRRRRGEDTPVTKHYERSPPGLSNTDMSICEETPSCDHNKIENLLLRAQAANNSSMELSLNKITDSLSSMLDAKLANVQRDLAMIDSKLNSTKQEIFREIKKEFSHALDKIKKDFSDTTDFLSEEIKSFKANLSSVNVKVQELQSENLRLNAELQSLKNNQKCLPAPSELHEIVDRMQMEINEREQALLLNDVEISGVPEHKAESTTHIVQAIGIKLGMNIDERDIVSASRVGPIRATNTESTAETDVASDSATATAPAPRPFPRPRPRPLVVRLSRRALRDEVLHFNINLKLPDNPNVRKLVSFMCQRNLEQMVREPTRITHSTETLIDLIITDCPSYLNRIYVNHNPIISDHGMVIAELNIPKPKKTFQYIYKRPLGNIDKDVNEKVKRFNQLLTSLFDKHAPIHRVRVGSHSYPWITDTIKVMMRLRDSALKRSRKTNINSHREYYKSLRNYTNNALEREKTAYFTYYVNKNKHQPKQMWNRLKNSASLGDNGQPLIPEHLAKPDEINNYFLKLPGSLDTDRETHTSFKNDESNDQHFDIKLCTEDQVSKIIKAINTEAAGHDNVSIEM
ncbi:hypothetical protein MSG28_014793, partial [Choristoneura fumiferana]